MKMEKFQVYFVTLKKGPAVQREEAYTGQNFKKIFCFSSVAFVLLVCIKTDPFGAISLRASIFASNAINMPI